MWPCVADVQVGVAAGGVDAVLLKVFADVVWGGLRQQPVNALPEEDIGDAWGGKLTEAYCVASKSTKKKKKCFINGGNKIPLGQYFQRFPALCPALNHPRSIKGCQEASSAACPHWPKGL